MLTCGRRCSAWLICVVDDCLAGTEFVPPGPHARKGTIGLRLSSCLKKDEPQTYTVTKGKCNMSLYDALKLVKCRIPDDHMVAYGTDAGVIGASPSWSA